jgi:hypothetical protein
MKIVTVESIEDLHLLASRLDFHVFRGQAEDWEPKPRLMRVLSALGIERGNYWNRERQMFREFRSRISLYSPAVSKPASRIDECSLLQHYGAPTRLLDFSKSLYVATFFSVEDVESSSDSVVWCLNEMKIRDNAIPREDVWSIDGNDRAIQYEEMRKLADGILNSEYEERKSTCFLLIEPWEKNERISRQQGVFLFQPSFDLNFIDCRKSIEENSSDPVEVNAESLNKVNLDENVVKIRIPKDLRMSILANLRKMNINQETLFPGIEGFCRSLTFELSIY